MKQRLTYLLRDVSEFNPDQIDVSANSIRVNGLEGAKEQHLTIGLSELPYEVDLSV